MTVMWSTVMTIIFGRFLCVSGVRLDIDIPFLHLHIDSDENKSDVRYLLFTRLNSEIHQELRSNDVELLKASNFNFNQPTKVIVHGWMSSGTDESIDEIKNAYLSITHFNIISVDWSKYAKTFYTLAKNHATGVSESLTQFLIFLVEHGVLLKDIHLIGHSAGAHVVGIAARSFGKQKTPIRVITALDPARPLFNDEDIDHRLDKSDATHVEVIHTCGGFLGTLQAVGHLDFYPNGGKRQKGCWWDLTGACSHNQAIMYFADSITSAVPYTAVKCKNFEEVSEKGICSINDMTLNMSGLHLNYGHQGIYYLKTKVKKPFALGDPINWYTYSESKRSETNIVTKLNSVIKDILEN